MQRGRGWGKRGRHRGRGRGRGKAVSPVSPPKTLLGANHHLLLSFHLPVLPERKARLERKKEIETERAEREARILIEKAEKQAAQESAEKAAAGAVVDPAIVDLTKSKQSSVKSKVKSKKETLTVKLPSKNLNQKVRLVSQVTVKVEEVN